MSTALTVTVWGASQFDEVNVNVERSTVAWPGVSLTTVSTTSLVGCSVSTTSNESVTPSSVTMVEPPDSVMTNSGRISCTMKLRSLTVSSPSPDRMTR